MKLAFFAALLSTLALAQDLKPLQEEAKDAFETEMESSLSALNTKCETKVTLKSDFENYDKEKSGNASMSGYCMQVVEGLTDLCGRPAFKKVLTKKLKGVTCLFAGVKAPKKAGEDSSNESTLQNMAFESGVFTYRMHPSVSRTNVKDNSIKVVEKALN